MDKRVLRKLTYGLYIVSSEWEGRLNGQVVNTVFQITSSPPQVAVSLNKENLTCEIVLKKKGFTVVVLEKETPLKYIGRFGFRSGRDFNKFEDIEYRTLPSGNPVPLPHALAYFEAEVEESLDLGSHILFVARVKDGAVLKEGEPLTYDYYHKVKGGFTAEKAPTYVEE